MPLYQMDTIIQKLSPVMLTSFVKENLQERKDLQPLLRDHPQYIEPDLMIVTEEFGNWEGSQRRIDLVGLDKEGNLVVIELKRSDGGSHMELQAIRYAAMLSAFDFEAVVAAHEAFLRTQNKDATRARQDIIDFLNTDALISNKPRIILISPSFSPEITTAVLWLNDIGLDIRCVEIRLYSIQKQLYLDMEQVIPLPSAADYQIKIREKSEAVQRSAALKRRESSISTLVAADVLKPSIKIYMIAPPRSGLSLGSDKAATTAIYIDNEMFEWEKDRAAYSISSLTRKVCEHLGGDVLSGSFAGPEYWAIEGETESLAKRAIALTDANKTASASASS